MRARSNSDLVAESKTLWYDFDQMCGCAEKLQRSMHANDRTVHNALVETFAISCRKLGCFFFPHDPGFPALRHDDLGSRLRGPAAPLRSRRSSWPPGGVCPKGG